MKARKQSSTSYPITFLMVSSTDHITGVTGLSPTVAISKNGAGFGAPSGAVTEVGYGWYQLAPNATDRNTPGDLLVHATGAGADPVDDKYVIVPFDPFDAAGLGLSTLDAAVSSRAPEAGGNVAAIRGKTDNLPPDPADESLLEAAIATRAAPGAEMALIDGAVTVAKAPNLDAAVSTRALEAGGNLATVMGKTNNLPTDPADESLLEAAIAGVLADTDNIQTRLPAALVGGKIDANVGSKTVGLALTAQEKSDVNAEVDAALDTAIPATPTTDSVNERVKSVDDRLPSDPSDQSAVEAAITAATANLDVAVSTRALEAGGNVAAIKAKTDLLPDDVVSSAYLDAWLTAIDDDVLSVLDSVVLHSGIIQSADATHIGLSSGAPSTNNLVGMLVVVNFPFGGAGWPQTRQIVGYNGGTKVAEVSRAWDVIPSAGGANRYTILASDFVGPGLGKWAYKAGKTFAGLASVMRSLAIGKTTGHTPTGGHPKFYDDDGATVLIEADVDADGNRSNPDGHGE